MLEFRDDLGETEKEELRQEIKQLKKEIGMYRSKESYIAEVNTILEKKVVSDDLYKTMFLYLTEALEELNTPNNPNLTPIKDYLENLISDMEVEITIGTNLYEKAYNGIQEQGTEPEEELQLKDLYEMRTFEEDKLFDLLGMVKMDTGFTEVSKVKLDRSGIDMKEWSGVSVWIMEPLLELVPGFAIFRRKEKKFFTSLEKEVISIFMQMVQPVLNGMILTKRLKAEVEQAMKLSETDPLTGLSNRQKFNSDYVDNPNSGREYIAYLDLCKLKHVNDTYGHDVADGVLVKLAHKIRDCATELGGVGYRLGGDEFIMRIPPSTEEEQIKEEIEKFKLDFEKASFKGLNEEGDTEVFHCKVSVGMQENKSKKLSKVEVMRRADELMYKGKEDRKNNPTMYSF